MSAEPGAGQTDAPPNVLSLVNAVEEVYLIWNDHFKMDTEISVAYTKPYFIGEGVLTRTAGLVQIRDYAVENDMSALLDNLQGLQERLKAVKNEFFDLVNIKLAYFGGTAIQSEGLVIPEKTKFEKALCMRLAVAGLLVSHLYNDPSFGRTKLAKIFYLADAHEGLNLQTEYYREAAGPLDQRALYNERFGIEALAQKHHLFDVAPKGKMIRYEPSSNFDKIQEFAAKHLGAKATNVIALAQAFEGLTTDQSEIVATLYACWNDFLIQKRAPTDDEIITEFLLHWHSRKARFSRTRLSKGLAWMRNHGIVPQGLGKLTSTKVTN